ncbi:MAG: TetR/AcrR family transcriptional regulator [Methanoregulaceae archaeon]
MTSANHGKQNPDLPSAGNRERILSAALHLFTTQGFHATPTAQISREAQVSTGTLFHYFPDKDTLIDQLYLSIKKELAETLRANDDAFLPVQDRLERYFRAYIAWGDAHREKVRFLEQFCNSPNIGDEVKQEVSQEFEWLPGLLDAAARQGFLQDKPLMFHYVMANRIINGILALMADGTSGLSREEIIDGGLAMLIQK